MKIPDKQNIFSKRGVELVIRECPFLRKLGIWNVSWDSMAAAQKPIAWQ
jgi:hypothetical protein